MNRDLQLWLKKRNLYEKGLKGGCACDSESEPPLIDFEDIKWGSFTKQFKAYKSQHKDDAIKTLDDFANMILADPSKFQKRTVKRARFYKNIIKKGEK
jgi:hypothetical protein